MTKARIEAPTTRHEPTQTGFWVSLALGAVCLVMLAAQLMVNSRISEMENRVEAFIDSRIEVAPADVLREVRGLRDDVQHRTADRFFRAQFESFLKNNPQLKAPDNWEK